MGVFTPNVKKFIVCIFEFLKELYNIYMCVCINMYMYVYINIYFKKYLFC